MNDLEARLSFAARCLIFCSKQDACQISDSIGELALFLLNLPIIYKLYSDSACTQIATALNVGTLNPGNTATQTIYIKNTGNVPETLTMTTNNWNPASASTSLTLTWNRQNTVLTAGQIIQATLTLTAAANTGSLTTFSCDVTITGTQ
jgi:hypothetical protein